MLTNVQVRIVNTVFRQTHLQLFKNYFIVTYFKGHITRDILSLDVNYYEMGLIPATADDNPEFQTYLISSS